MQLGKSLLGAIIGAAVGIVLLIVVYMTLGKDQAWLSIPFAIITGLGVRMMVNTAGHASYVRGAMTMVVALAGYIGGWLLVEQVVSARTIAAAKAPAAGENKSTAAAGDTAAKDTEAKDTEAKDAEAKDETADESNDADKQDAESAPKAAPASLPKAIGRSSESAMPRPASSKVPSTPWDIICLAIAALVAYEMGRGSGTGAPNTQSSQPMPGSTHPDA